MTGVISCEKAMVRLGKEKGRAWEHFTLGPVSLELERGYITGLVGRNGAGKTTLIRMLAQYLPLEAGEIRYGGNPFLADEVENRRRVRACLGGVQLVSQASAENLADSIAFFEPWFDRDFFREQMRRFQLPAEEKTRCYSTGMRKIFELILTMSRKPETLLLDEPFSGVDPVTRRALLELLQAFMEDETHTVLYSTHQTEDLDRVADRLVLIEGGQILLDEETDSLKERFAVLDGSLPSIEKIMQYACGVSGERRWTL